MQQPPQGQPPYYVVNPRNGPLQSPWQPVYTVVEPVQPKPKNTTMKSLSIICFSAFMVLIVLTLLASGSQAPTIVLGILGCTWLLSFIAGFIFLCLI